MHPGKAHPAGKRTPSRLRDILSRPRIGLHCLPCNARPNLFGCD